MNLRATTTTRAARLIVAMAVVISFTGTGAWAFWRAGGSGTANARNGTLQPVSVGLVSFGQTLRPGGSPTAVNIVLANPNAVPVVIATLAAGAVSSNLIGCGDSGNPTGVTLDLHLAAGTIPALSSRTISAAAAMDITSVSACQGATFSAPLTLTVHT